MATKTVVIPVDKFIESKTRDGNKLYEAEAQMHEQVRECANLWLIVMGKNAPGALWERGISQALYDLLQSYSTGAAYAAAKKFVNRVEHKAEPFSLEGVEFVQEDE